MAMTSSFFARGDANRSLINRHSSGIRLRLSAATAYDARITHTQTPHPAHAPASETPSLPTRRRSPVCTVSRSVAHFLHTRISRQRCPLPLSRSAAQPLSRSAAHPLPTHTHLTPALSLTSLPRFAREPNPRRTSVCNHEIDEARAWDGLSDAHATCDGGVGTDRALGQSARGHAVARVVQRHPRGRAFSSRDARTRCLCQRARALIPCYEISICLPFCSSFLRAALP